MSTTFDYDPDTGEVIDAASNQSEYSVSEIAHALKRTIEDRFGHVRIRGEISGFRGPHSSGHCYFALKDDGAKIDAVMWKGNYSRLRAKLQEGLEVIATGKLTSYPAKSGYQIVIDNIEPAGVGALMALLDERKKMLAAEGLFDQDRKQAIPFLPRVIGIVTSPTGAVIRDILHRLNDRFPRHVLVWPVRVQGETAAAEVAQAIAGFNAMAEKPDLIIVARGGGSLEDLWSFNEEIVVRAVAASKIPLISAIGHETDTTLIDFVSDYRAPTPTAAAEFAVPVRADLLAAVAALSARHKRSLTRSLQEKKSSLISVARALPKPDDVFQNARQRLDYAAGHLAGALMANVQKHAVQLAKVGGRITIKPMQQRIVEQRRRISELRDRMQRSLKITVTKSRDQFQAEAKLFASLNYHSVLARGFAVVRDAQNKPITLAADAAAAKSLNIEFADGVVPAVPQKKSPQGSLF